MPKCFIIQPFEEKYQKLYVDVYEPAIREADVEPYKVDDDPGVNVPIETIEKQIRDCDFCFAEISEDNPNVWYELGYAMASGIGFCIVCSKQKRALLPFDIRHKSVLFYDAEAPSDFLKLQKQITERIVALKQQATMVRRIAKGVPSNSSIEAHELTVLALVAAEQVEFSGSVAIYKVRNAITKAGYTEIAFAMAFNKFQTASLLEAFDEHDPFDQEDFRACRLTEAGWDLLRKHEDRLQIKILKDTKLPRKMERPSSDFDDEIPF